MKNCCWLQYYSTTEVQAGWLFGIITQLKLMNNRANKIKEGSSLHCMGKHAEVNKALNLGRAAAADLLVPAPLNKAPVTAEL